MSLLEACSCGKEIQSENFENTQVQIIEHIFRFNSFQATNYSATAGKPLLNGTSRLNASFFNNSSKNVPGTDPIVVWIRSQLATIIKESKKV